MPSSDSSLPGIQLTHFGSSDGRRRIWPFQRVRSPLGTLASSRPFLVFAVAFAALEVAEAYFRRFTSDGLHFQSCTSEFLMQSVSVRDLGAAPFESLWYLHIQPPMCNLIRAVLAVLHRGVHGPELIRVVDRDLFHVWAIAAAALAALVDRWLLALRLPGWLAALLTIGWFLHPANIGYATLLDGTLPSAALTTWVVYATWRVTCAGHRSSRELVAAVLLAYLTRSVFQWPFVLVMVGALWLARLPRRQIAVFGLAVGVVVSLYSVKQELLFGTVSTSTSRGQTSVTRLAPIASTLRRSRHRG